MFASRLSRPLVARAMTVEHLEQRFCLSNLGVVDGPATCQLAPAGLGEADRAAHAINCFAIDLYENLQQEQGNLFLSPASITTALAMAYAGAAGETATEMENVLHLGSEPGIHDSFGALVSSYQAPASVGSGFELELANAMWPKADLPIRDEFIRTIESEYDGQSQSLDYSNPDEARGIINEWIEQKTRGKIKDVISGLSPATVMVLTNSIYFKALWANPFDPMATDDGQFFLNDGQTVDASLMYTEDVVPYTELHGFEVLEMPFQGGATSMVFMLPKDRGGTNLLTADLMSDVNEWLASPRNPNEVTVIQLPRFKATVETGLETLLPEMGMRSAFGNADFSGMTDAAVNINSVRHKAFLEVNEQGTEAAAATSVLFAICFAEGTPVQTPDGEIPIEQLQAGDFVLSRDEHSVEGKIEKKRVIETFCRHEKVLELHVGGQVIRATREHPFFVRGQGWTKAGDLRPGNLLATDLSSWMEVEQVTASEHEEPVYNLRVADHHTYFVGREKWGFAIWTHNVCGDARVFRADHPFHFFIRDNSNSAILFMGRLDDPTQTENALQPTIQRVTGDSNGDGRFTSSDLVLAFAAGKYEDGIPGNASFEDGDWDCDGDFTSTDLVLAFQSGTYEDAVAPSRSAPTLETQASRTEADRLPGVSRAVKVEPLDAVFGELGRQLSLFI